MSYTIYVIRCSQTSKVYVGQTKRPIRQRLSGHISDAHRRPERSKLWAAIRKYGRDSFSIHALEECKSADEASYREIFWIGELDSINSGYNIASGGRSPTWTPEQRQKFSDNHPLKGVTGEDHPAHGYHHTEEARKRIGDASRARTGRVFSDEHRANLSKAQKGKSWEERMGKEKADELRERRKSKSNSD